MKFACHECGDPADVAEWFHDAGTAILRPLCDNCACQSHQTNRDVEPLPDLAALRRDAAQLRHVREIAQEWADRCEVWIGPQLMSRICKVLDVMGKPNA